MFGPCWGRRRRCKTGIGRSMCPDPASRLGAMLLVFGLFEAKGCVGCREQSVCAVLPKAAGTTMGDVVIAEFCSSPVPFQGG
jgi:hypothetical protein